MRDFHDDMSAGRGGLVGAAARPVLWAASRLYRVTIGVRNRRYDKPGSSVRVGAFVISVGNITTGGTGKTPVTIEIATRLLSAGREVAVVARGYNARPGETPDELALVQRSCPAAVCIANPDRVAGATRAIEENGADVIVLDDGFQHRRIARDLDIVLIDATEPFGRGHMLPRGFLREPIESLARADLIVVTRADHVEPDSLGELRRNLDAFSGGKPCIVSRHAACPPRALGASAAIEVIETPPVVHLLSGIGNPASFRRTVEDLGLRVAGETRFTDHHRYTAADVARVCTAAKSMGCRAVVTTAKDEVKIEDLDASAWVLPLWVVDVRVEFADDGGAILDTMLRDALQASPER